MRVEFVGRWIKGYGRFMKTMDTLKLLKEHPEIVRKLEIIKFFDEFGAKATKQAFRAARSTVYGWKKSLRASGGRLHTLANASRKPQTTRRMIVEEKTYLFIKSLRQKYPRLGKEKIVRLLKPYTRKENLQTISGSTIGKLIRRKNWFFYLGERTKTRVKINRKRVFGYPVKELGDLFRVDAIVRFDLGVKRYIFTAIDPVSKFTFAQTYASHSAECGAKFIETLRQVAPYPIRAIQTDNGSEFLGKCDRTMDKYGIVHFFGYPRSPKQNAHIERFNRTLQEEFVDANTQHLPNLQTFNNLLVDYLLFYNTERPHQALKYRSPMAVVVDHLQKSNMYATNTSP